MKDFSNEEWGLVLNGGGGKGSYQIGVFKALFEHHINDCIIAVSGTSSGALNSVLFANGDLNVAVNAWQDITPKSFLRFIRMLSVKHSRILIMRSYTSTNDIICNYSTK